MRIAHISDLHLLALEGAVPMRLFNKRMTGYLNLKLRRQAVHKPFAVRAAARAIRELGVDHVVVTGDLSNLSLEREFDLARRLLEEDLGLPSESISVVPGNHDAYTGGAFRSQRFARVFASFVTSDLPFALDGSAFPFVRLRGPVAVIGLSTAVPRLPFVASGELGAAQLDALARVLDHPEVRSRTPVILQHHPLHPPKGRVHRLMEGLLDADAEVELLRRVPRGLVLHGHLHRRIQRSITTVGGSVDVVGATSASLLDAREERMGGFNLYDISDTGVVTQIASRRLDPATERFDDAALPSAV